jgi:hypothetical protein
VANAYTSLLTIMDAQIAFVGFVNRVLTAKKAVRFTAIAATETGRRRILDSLNHEFAPAIRADAIRHNDREKLYGHACYVFHSGTGFGVEFTTVREAYAELSTEDGWLILLRDGSAGLHRPEGRWDDEKWIGR